MNLLCYNTIETIFIHVDEWISDIKMLENHGACFWLNLRNRELVWIALKIRKKTFLKVLNKPIILKYPLKIHLDVRLGSKYAFEVDF